MASFLKKFVSGLDFWDKDENRRQREQFAREEEEERKRRAAQQRQSVFRNTPQPGEIIQPDNSSPPEFDFSSPLSKVGSQSNFQNLTAAKVPTNVEELNDKENLPQARGSQLGIDELENLRERQKKREGLRKFRETDANLGKEFGSATLRRGIYEPLIELGSGLQKINPLVSDEDVEKDRQQALDVGREVLPDLPDEKRSNLVKAVGLVGEYGSPVAAGAKVGNIVSKAPKVANLTNSASRAARIGGRSARELAEGSVYTAQEIGKEKARNEDPDIAKAIRTGAAVDVASGLVFGRFGKFRPSKSQPNVRAGADDEVEAGVRAVKQSEDAVDDLPGTKKISSEEGKPAVEVESGIRSTNIPDPAAQRFALTKAADEGMDSSGAPIANFRNPADGSQPLQKAEGTGQVRQAVDGMPEQQELALEQPPARVDTTSEVDVQGNPILQSDAAAAREMAEQGIVPARGDSVAEATEAELEAAARRAAREEVDLTGAPAPRTREQASNRITDEDLRTDVLEAFPEKQSFDIEANQKQAISDLNQLPDEEVVRMFGNDDFAVKSPEGYLRAVESIRRLERVNTPESDVAIKNVVNAIADFSSESGRNLRVVQTLFDDMPPTMKTEMLADRLAKAGVDLTDAERAVLSERILLADEATMNLRNLEEDAAAVLESLQSGQPMNPRIAQTVTELSRQIDEARAQKETLGGEAWRYYQEKMPPAARGTRFADVGRTMMLSAPSGRIFDQISTAATAVSDLTARNVSSLIGKGVNLVKGGGTVQDTFSAPSKLVKGIREGAKRIRGSLAGKDYVEDVSGTLQRSTRGDINTGGGPVRKFVRTMTEAPTNLTRGIRNDELYRLGMQEAAELGLKGQERRAFAELRGSIPTQQQLDAASEAHMSANMLHRNPISKGLNQFARFLDSKGQGLGALFIRNQVAPFTSWLGGNLHRTLTDKNVIYNTYKIADSARKGDAQGVVDNISRLAVNTGQAAALGYGLTEAGVITDTDANGNSYGGLYFNIGDRYIPVAIVGVNSVPIILGNSVHKGMQSSEDGEDFLDATANAATNGLVNTVQNAGVASVFGGENNLQDTINSLARESQKEPGDRNLNPLLEYGGNIARQFIPGIGADANAFLDNSNLNPTGEAPRTTITEENPETGRQKKNVWETEVAKTKSRIPFLSQSLEREEGSAAKDSIDRITKGNRETPSQVQEREEAQTKAEIEADREERGIPKTTDGIIGAAEKGNYDDAIEGYRWKLERAEEDGEISSKTKKKIFGEIKRLEITRDGNYDPEIMETYKDTSLTEWRKMGDPDSEDYNPEMFELLAEYDQKLAKNKVSRYSGDPTKTRYYTKDSKRGGGRGGGSGRGPRFVTDIATQSAPSYTFSPIKPEKASFAQRDSVIPVLEKVPNYSRQQKKISVKRGGRV